MNPSRAVGLLGLICLLGGGCAATQELTRDLPGVKFVKYTMAGADREQRASLDRGLTQLRAFEYDPAVRSLRQAIWDVELIDKRSLRLEELVEVHQALAEAYAGLGKNASARISGARSSAPWRRPSPNTGGARMSPGRRRLLWARPRPPTSRPTSAKR